MGYVPSLSFSDKHKYGTRVFSPCFKDRVSQNQRVDNLLHVLLKLNRDIIFNTLRKEEVGKVTHRVRDINRRHVSAKEMLDSDNVDVQRCESGKWKVRSESNSSYYDVALVGERDNCPLSCTACNVCIHMYTCNCVDAAYVTQHNLQAHSFIAISSAF